jgi:putative ABC transport system permease protein
MTTLLQDLRYALRRLGRSPAFTAVAVLTLALGIGANTAIFSVVNTVLLRPLPYREPDRLVWIWANSPRQGIPFHFFLYPDFVEWRAQARSCETMAAYAPAAVTLTNGATAEAEHVPRLRVSASFFRLLGVRPALGRDFVEADDQPGAPRVVMLSHELWQRRYGSEPGVVGRMVTLDGEGYTAVGVLPPGFRAANLTAQLYTPIALDGSRTGPGRRFSHGAFARLARGVTAGQAQAETNLIVDRLDPNFFRWGGRGIRLWGVREFLVREVRLSLLVLTGAVGLVLLVACANVANLLLARATTRQREIAVRATLGAGRWRLMRQLLTESSLLGLLGGGLGLLAAYWGVKLLVAVTPANYPLVAETRIDGQVLGFTLLLSVATGVLFGLAPAVSLSRTSLQEALKEGGRSATGGAQHHRVRSLLVVVEVALAAVLAIGAGLLLKGFWRLQGVNPGFEAKGVLTAGLSLPAARYATGERRAAFHRELASRLETLPGVQAAGIVTALPLGGYNTGTAIHIQGQPEPRPDEAPVVWFRAASPGYFRAMQIPLKRGRLLSARDLEGAERVALVNETMARRFWPGLDPIGQRFGLGLSHRPPAPDRPALPWITVVGVVGDVRHTALAQPAEAEYFESYLQRPFPAVTVVVRTPAEPERFAPSLRAAVAAVDKGQPVSEVTALERWLFNSIAPQRLATVLLGIFAGLALALATVGVYAVMSFSVERRTHEIGVRLALGAERGDVLRLVLRQGMTLALAGLGAGLVGALFLGRVMRGLLFGVTATDPAVFAAAAAALAVVALVATWIPARRATRVEPSAALRYE